jgi:hypothetical protein
MAYTPPPAALKPEPYALVLVVLTPQPVCESPAPQWLSTVVVPMAELELLTVQPGEVCKVMVSVVALLTPSMMSISPLAGQFGPKDQNEGQVLYTKLIRRKEFGLGSRDRKEPIDVELRRLTRKFHQACGQYQQRRGPGLPIVRKMYACEKELPTV